MTGVPNWANRTMWTGDNLHIMRGMNSETVDLIYLDPPFNSNRDYSAPIGSAAAGAAFKDTWTLDDVDLAWHGEIAEQHPALYAIIGAAGVSHGKRMMAYLIMMAVRVLEMKRLLTPTGSIYLHCDDSVSHYLKLLMDAIFGPTKFRNHIVWRRATSHNDSRRFDRNVDHLLFYTNGDKWTWNAKDVSIPKSEEELRKAYPQSDNRGMLRFSDLTGANVSMGESGLPWRGYDVSAKGRHWSPPSKAHMRST